LFVAMVAVGCGRRVTPSAANKAFEAAPAAVKATWEKALSASATNDYAMSISLLRSLRPEPSLTAKQQEALSETISSITERMMDAANRGDADAQKAMADLNAMRGR
jgi:hypothetical protein